MRGIGTKMFSGIDQTADFRIVSRSKSTVGALVTALDRRRHRLMSGVDCAALEAIIFRCALATIF
jgi:hypothetical protein